MKSDQDRASYNNEFKDLQAQLYDISKMKFNGVSLFAEHTLEKGATQAVFGGKDQDASLDNTLTIYTSAEGAAGSKVSVHKSVLLSALTFSTSGTKASVGFNQAQNASLTGDETQAFNATFATQSGGVFLDLEDISVGVISQALENIAFLRAQNGGVHSRLAFNSESLTQQKDQYACGSWANGRCGHRRGDNQPGEVFGTLSGICKHAGPSQCQHRFSPHVTAITGKAKQ